MMRLYLAGRASREALAANKSALLSRTVRRIPRSDPGAWVHPQPYHVGPRSAIQVLSRFDVPSTEAVVRGGADKS